MTSERTGPSGREPMIGGMYLKGVDADGRFEARHEAAKRCESASKIQAVKASTSIGNFARRRKPEIVAIEAGCVEAL
jgi:hypothetical protein